MASGVGQTVWEKQTTFTEVCFRESQCLVSGWKRGAASQYIFSKVNMKDKIFLYNFQCSVFIFKNGGTKVFFFLYLKTLKRLQTWVIIDM